MRRREFLVVPLALAACATAAAPRRLSGWAALDEGWPIAEAVRPEHRIDVRSRTELVAAMRLGAVPKLLRIHGRIDLSGGLGEKDFADRDFDFDAYRRAYAPEVWGRRPLSGP